MTAASLDRMTLLFERREQRIGRHRTDPPTCRRRP
jgi:hypothetical protein